MANSISTFVANLQANTQTVYANNGNTTILGRATQKTLNSQQVIGPALTQFIDLQTLASIVPGFIYYNPNTNHLFVRGPVAAGPTVMLINFNNLTGAYSYVGKVVLSLANAAATTYTSAGLSVYESGSTINILMSDSGTVAINGGTYLAWGLTTAAFTVGGTTIYPANGSNQAAMYFLQDPSAPGVNHVATTPWGNALPQFSTGYIFTVASANATAGATYTNNGQTFTVASTIAASTQLVMISSTGAPLTSGTLTKASGTGDATITFSAASSVGTKVWQWNGTLAAPQLYSWDLSVTPTVAGMINNGVNAQTTLYSGTSPSAFFTMGSSNNGYAATNGEQVVLQNGTGNVPTAFNAWSAGSLQVAASNVYFMRDLQQLWVFTFTGLTTAISAGATYTNGGFTFTCVSGAALSATTATFTVTGTGISTPTGNLVLASGTGQNPITILTATAGNFYFNLGTTSGGAAVTPTSSNANFTMMRAFGICTSNFSLKTGVLSTAFALGTILKVDSVGYCRPISAPANTALNNQDCMYMSTTTGLYIGKIADLTSGGTTWASMTFAGVNNNGTGLDTITPTTAFSGYSGQNNIYDVDRFVIINTASEIIVKPYQNSNISMFFGGSNGAYFETLNPQTVQLGIATPGAIHVMGGWVFIGSTAAGQRGIQFFDLYSDQYFGNTAVISAVQSISPGAVFGEVSSYSQIPYLTARPNYYIRSASTSTDPIFSVATGNWTQISPNMNLSSITVGPYFQLMNMYNCVINAGSPAQVNDIIYSVILPNSMSTNWEGSVDNTTANGATPAYSSFRMTTAYASVVPPLYFRAYDDLGNLVASANTSANPTLFQYTTVNGAPWNNLGTVPNTALTTEVRYLWATPPGVRVTCSLRES